MTTTVKNRYTGATETYTLPPVEALVSAAMCEDGCVGYITDAAKRNFYRGLIVHGQNGLRLTNWEVVSE